MNRPLCIAVSVLLAFTALGAERPNILVFIADDLGLDGVGCYGSFRHEAVELPRGENPATWRDKWGRPARPSDTPTIDRLAANGVRFGRCYATGICSPSRAQFATGQYPFRNGTLDIDGSDDRLNPNKPSLTQLMNEAGYTTGKTGKADIDKVKAQESLNAGQYWKKDRRNMRGYGKTGPTALDPESFDYGPAAQLAFALDFIDRNVPSEDNGHKPFYFIQGFHLPHTPIHPTPDSLECHGGAPAGETEEEREVRWVTDMIRYMDRTVAAVVAKLEEHGQIDNTLILFVGDNGSSGEVANKLWDSASKTYRLIEGRKADRFENREGTALVPMIVHWPDGISEERRNTVIHDLVDFTDVLPSFASLAGAGVPGNWVLDGHNILPLIQGGTCKPREWVFHQIQNNWCVRSVDYRLNRDGRFFDMRGAPFKSKLIETPTPEESALRARLQTVLDELDPINGPTYEAHQDGNWGGREKYAKDNPGIAAIWKWKEGHFNAAERWVTAASGDAADPDKDGVPNALERVFGWDPNNGSDTMPRQEIIDGSLVLSLPAIEAAYTRAVVEVALPDGSWRALEAQDKATVFTVAGPTDQTKLRIRAERTAEWPEP